MRVRGNSTCRVPSSALILMPRSAGYRSLASPDAQGIFVVPGPSIRQTPSKVCAGDLIPNAMGALKSVMSDSPKG